MKKLADYSINTKRIFFNFIILLSIDVYSSNFIGMEDQSMTDKMYFISKQCDINTNFLIESPVSYSKAYHVFSNALKEKNLDDYCNFKIEFFLNLLRKKSNKLTQQLGYEYLDSQYFFQDKSKRLQLDSNLYYLQSYSSKNFAYNLKIRKNDENEFTFDESYFSFLINNLYISMGRKERWWGPSNETSLIFSNSSRPQLGISLGNYKRLEPKTPIIKKIIGNYDFEIFLNKLENNRFIPKTLMLGNRFSFNPHERVNISLSRIAMFSGKGRSLDSDDILRIILGNDTGNSEIDSSDTPGNQIAGIDLNISLLKHKNLDIYGQLYGEDGLDPIIDDRWIGAIFPSKRFSSFGLKFSQLKLNSANYIAYDSIDTYSSSHPNITYNHNIYKSGYRYYDLPIGASIDADSKSHTFTIFRELDKSFLKIRLSRIHLNRNNNNLSIFSTLNNKFSMASFSYETKISRYLTAKINYQITSENLTWLDKNSISIDLNYSW